MLSDEVIEFIEEKHPRLGENLSVCIGVYQNRYCFIENPLVDKDVFKKSVDYVIAHMDELKDVSRYYLVPSGLHYNLDTNKNVYCITGEPIGLYLSHEYDKRSEIGYIYDMVRGGYSRIYGIGARGERILLSHHLGFLKYTNETIAALTEHIGLEDGERIISSKLRKEEENIMKRLKPFLPRRKADFESAFPDGIAVLGCRYDLKSGPPELHKIVMVKNNGAIDDKGVRHWADHLFLHDESCDYALMTKELKAIKVRWAEWDDKVTKSLRNLDEVKRKFAIDVISNARPRNYLSVVEQ